MENRQQCNSTDVHQAYKVYYNREQLGRGGFGTVYFAGERLTGDEYAMKIIDRAKLKIKGPNLEERVWNEIFIHKKLNHPNIVKMKECFEDSKFIYMVLECCKGGDLRHFIDKRLCENLHLSEKSRFLCLSEKESASYLYQLINGLMYLHGIKIIHRDLSVSNVLLMENFATVKLCDFGLSTRLSYANEKHNTMVGTQNFLSPEIANGCSHSFETDVFSLGAVFYSMLTGESKELTCQGLKLPSKDSIKVALQNIRRLVSPETLDLLARLLCYEPEKRIRLCDAILHPFVKKHADTRKGPIIRGRQCSQASLQDSGFGGASLDRLSLKDGSRHGSKNLVLSSRRRSISARPFATKQEQFLANRPPLGFRRCPSADPTSGCVGETSASRACCLHSNYDEVENRCLKCHRLRSVVRPPPAPSDRFTCIHFKNNDRSGCSKCDGLDWPPPPQLRRDDDRRGAGLTCSSATTQGVDLQSRTLKAPQSLRLCAPKLNTRGLRAQSVKCDRYGVDLLDDGSINLNHIEEGVCMKISKDGCWVEIEKSDSSDENRCENLEKLRYSYETLPKLYWPCYKLAFRFIAAIRAKLPCLTFQNPTGNFYLRNNGSFDGHFFNGKVICKSREELHDSTTVDLISDIFLPEEKAIIQQVLKVCLYSIKLNVEAAQKKVVCTSDTSKSLQNKVPVGSSNKENKFSLQLKSDSGQSSNMATVLSEMSNCVKEVEQNIYRILDYKCLIKVPEGNSESKIQIKYDDGNKLVQTASYVDFFDKWKNTWKRYTSQDVMPADLKQKVNSIRRMLLVVQKFKVHA